MLFSLGVEVRSWSCPLSLNAECGRDGNHNSSGAQVEGPSCPYFLFIFVIRPDIKIFG